MAAKWQRIIVGICVAVLLGALFWPIGKELRFQNKVKNDTSVMVARQTPTRASDYIVRDEQNYVSPGGVFYGKDLSGKFGSRIAHIMAHTAPDESKPKHSVFTATTREDVLRLIDEAWKRRGPPVDEGNPKGRDVYDVSLGRVVGTEGERHIRLVMERNTPQIITAYPVTRTKR